MNGWDFKILWEAGRAVLEGGDPYAVEHFFYPLPVAYWCALFALFPYPVAFGLWLAINAALFIYFFRRLVWVWMLYAPVLHLFSSGQVEMLFWSLERFIYPSGDENRSPGWRGAALVALITLKPQVALVLLPWYGLHWLRHDRLMLARAAVTTALLWGVPLLWRPDWLSAWYSALPPASFLESAGNAPGLWSLIKPLPALWPLVAFIAAGILAWTFWQPRTNAVMRACAQLALPVGMFYSTFALLGTAPARLLVPVSLLAAAATVAVNNFAPFMALPLAVIIWHDRHKPAARASLPPGYIYARVSDGRASHS